MQTSVPRPRQIYHRLQRFAHPWIGTVLPVTYLPEEVSEHKRHLDPTGARSRQLSNDATNARLQRLASVFSLDRQQVQTYLDEARSVELAPVPKGSRLASPMCYEDQYTIYLVTRAMAPSVAIETGIAYGVSSAYILAALHQAQGAVGGGRLVSIERSIDPAIGACVPDHLRNDWTVRTGDSLSVLPEVLATYDPIDLFVHDSWHGYSHMRREYELAWSHIRSGGVLCSHDILATNAFQRFVRAHSREIDLWLTSVNFGLIRKR